MKSITINMIVVREAVFLPLQTVETGSAIIISYDIISS